MDPITLAALIAGLAQSLANLADVQHRLAQGQQPTADDENLLRAEIEAERVRLGKNTGHTT